MNGNDGEEESRHLEDQQQEVLDYHAADILYHSRGSKANTGQPTEGHIR